MTRTLLIAGRAASSAQTHTLRMLIASADKRKSVFQTVIAPADGTITAALGNGDFGTSPFFGQLSDEP
jgi:hypothetical protein